MDDQDNSNEASDQPNLNTTMTLSTPDIVSSCDRSSSAQDSFGMPQPGKEEMADFNIKPNSGKKIESKLERLSTKRSKEETFNASKVPARFASIMNSTVVLSKGIDHQPSSSNHEVQASKLPPESSSTLEEDKKQTPSHFLMSSVPCHSTPLSDLSGCLEMVAPLVDGIEHIEPMIRKDDVDQVVSKNSNNFLEADDEIPNSNSNIKALELMDGKIKLAAKPTLKPKPALKSKQSVLQSRVSKPKLPNVVQCGKQPGPKQPLVKTLLSQNPRSTTKDMLLVRKSSVASNTPKPKFSLLKVATLKPQMSISKPPIKQVAPISVQKSSVAPIHAVGRLASTKSTLKVQRSESSLSSSSTKSNISSKSNTSESSTKSKPSNLPKSGSIISNKKTEIKLICGRKQETSSSTLSSSGRLSIDKKSSKNLPENRSSSKILQKSVSNLSAGRRPTTTSLSKTSISRSGMKSDESTCVKLSNTNLPKSNMKPSSKSFENASKSSLSTMETVSATGARSKYPESSLSRKTTTNGPRSTLTSRLSKDPVKSPNLKLKTNTNSTTGNGQLGLTSSNSFIATEVTAKPSFLPRSLSNISSGVKQTPRHTVARKLSDVNSLQPGKINPAGRISPKVTPVRSIQRVPSSHHLLTPRGSQPDLIMASTPRSDLQKEVTKLQSCLAAKIEELDHVKLAITDNNVAFDALAIVAKNLLDETEQARSLQYNLEAYKSRNHSLQLEMENSKQKHKLAEEDFNKLLLQLGRDIETMCRKHEEEKDTVKEAHRCQLEAQKLDLQEEMRKRKHRSEKDLALLGEKHRTEILRLENAYVTSLTKEKALSQDKKREQLQSFEVEKDSLEQKIEQLESKVSALVINLMNGPDHRDGAMAVMQKEIDSLRSVVDMRNADIKSVKEENQRLCQKLSTFKEMKEKVRNLSSQVEDMKELLAIKRSNERKLDAELHQLQESMHKTSREKRRLSIEKEQLEWRMKQGIPMQRCLVEETQSHSFSGETRHSRRNVKTFHFRSPSMNNTEPLPLHSYPMDYSPPPISSTPSALVVDYRTSRASVSYQLDLSDCLTPDSARTVRRRQRRLDTGLGDRE